MRRRLPATFARSILLRAEHLNWFIVEGMRDDDLLKVSQILFQPMHPPISWLRKATYI
jgi:hypothetical protein